MTSTTSSAPPVPVARLAVAWLVVGIPLIYGVYETLLKAVKLFTG